MIDIDKSIGFKDMHEAQVKELMDFCAMSLSISEQLSDLTDDPELHELVCSSVESLVEIFGGDCVILGDDTTTLQR